MNRMLHVPTDSHTAIPMRPSNGISRHELILSDGLIFVFKWDACQEPLEPHAKQA